MEGGPTEEEQEQDKTAQLAEYKQQLAIVDQTIAITAEDDETYQQLKDARGDLVEVIKLLEEVVAIEEEKPPASTGPPVPAGPPAHNLIGGSEAQSSSHPRVAGRGHELVGRCCEVYLGKQWYNAEIYAVRKDERGVDRAVLTVFGERERKEMKLSELRMLRALAPAACLPGTKLQAMSVMSGPAGKWANGNHLPSGLAISVMDGLWYDCVVEEHTDKGYLVRFTDYNTRDDVKFDQVRQKAAKQSALGTGLGKRGSAKEIVTPGGYVIPEHFLVKPEDTDEVKAKKKRKIHHVKAQQKDERVEEDALKKAGGWQKFMQKNGKQKGFIKSGGAKQSIFASADKGLAAGGGPASSSSMARPASAAPGAFFRR
eukprot:g11595.t1